MDIKGKVKLVKETQTVGTGSFQKREIIITTIEDYPQTLCIEFIQDKCSLLDGLKEGEEVTIYINLRGREWTAPGGEVKYFNSIQGWKIEREAAANNSEMPDLPPLEEDDMRAPANDDDIMPF